MKGKKWRKRLMSIALGMALLACSGTGVLATDSLNADVASDAGQETGKAYEWEAEELKLTETTPVDSEAHVISISPDGSTVLLSDFSVFKNNKVVTLRPKNPGENEEAWSTYLNTGLDNLAGAGGVAWSTDGRYATVCNGMAQLLIAQNFGGVVLIDTVTGEMTMLEAFPKRFPLQMAACFDTEDKYLYYELCDNYDTEILGQEIRCQGLVKRYCLETGAIEECFKMQELPYPGMCMAGGSMVTISAPNGRNDFGKIHYLEETDSGWTLVSLPFSLCLESFVPRQLHYNKRSDQGLVYGYSGTAMPCLVQFTAAAGLKLSDQYIALTAGDEPEAVQLSKEAFEAADKNSYLYICTVQISPDGRYALLLCGSHQEQKLVLLNLETLETKTVETEEDMNLLESCVRSSSNSSMIWCPDGTVVFFSKEGTKTYHFSA